MGTQRSKQTPALSIQTKTKPSKTNNKEKNALMSNDHQKKIDISAQALQEQVTQGLQPSDAANTNSRS